MSRDISSSSGHCAIRTPLELLPIPVERPPNELLALIFKVAADLPLRRHELPVPLVVAGVSTRWRAVVLSSPRCGPRSAFLARRHLAHAALFLQRSIPLPFRLGVNTEHPTRLVDSASLWNVLQPHVARCSALALCVSEDELKKWNVALREQRTSLELRLLSLTRCASRRSTCVAPGTAPSYALCHHTRVLETLVLRDYSASVFAGAPPNLLAVAHGSHTRIRNDALVEGLINVTLFLDLPNLARLHIKGSHVPSVGDPLNPSQARAFHALRTLRLEDVAFLRPLETAAIQMLSAGTPLPLPVFAGISVRALPAGPAHSVPGELAFYASNIRSAGGQVEFERELRAHACSDFCALHNQSPWGDTRSDAERDADRDAERRIRRTNFEVGWGTPCRNTKGGGASFVCVT
ncbi:hypothetical protein B0H17DRAFT_1119293 [Mycena rosella]|uniref:Uncharacterized protein n=1 Tax=Mycena rosella TaxID=1033263 RepID=A0AAD7B175_MYCRO|nr:hypothetical protein B0H17DRAFT_1119293 [Mycena rosella]